MSDLGENQATMGDLVTDAAAEFAASTFDVLARRLITTEQKLAAERRAHESTRLDLDLEREKNYDVGERLTKANKLIREMEADAERAKKAAEKAADNLRQVDQLTLDLYLYIVELAGHRDAAKTKAERVAVGHVVERLAEIRGLNDAEREAIG